MPARAVAWRQLELTNTLCEVRCWVQVRRWSGLPGRMEHPQAHRMTGAFAGPAGRPRRKRAESVNFTWERVRGKDAGMVSYQSWSAGMSVGGPGYGSLQGRAGGSQHVNCQSARCWPCACRVLLTGGGARRVALKAQSAGAQRQNGL
jgi:hypothetical protein